VKRREFILTLAGAALTAPLAARAQLAGAPIVGFVTIAAPQGAEESREQLSAGLAEAGFVEGKNVVIEYRSAFRQYDRLPTILSEFVRLKVAVIVTGGNVSAVAAKGVTQTIPIVFNVGTDPVSLGLVASLSHPGGNATGIAVITERLTVKRLELMQELAPKGSTLGFLVNPDNEDVLPDLLKTAQSTGQKLLVMKARDVDGLEASFARFSDAHVGGLVVSNDAFFNSERDRLIALAARHSIPTVYEFPEYSKAGGLLSYGPRLTEVYRDCGRCAGRILKGASPADLPVEQPTRFALVVNLKTAKALSISIPAAMLIRADEVIE
jgi:putative ABC transport system substrate-binding protein